MRSIIYEECEENMKTQKTGPFLSGGVLGKQYLIYAIRPEDAFSHAIAFSKLTPTSITPFMACNAFLTFEVQSLHVIPVTFSSTRFIPHLVFLVVAVFMCRSLYALNAGEHFGPIPAIFYGLDHLCHGYLVLIVQDCRCFFLVTHVGIDYARKLF